MESEVTGNVIDFDTSGLDCITNLKGLDEFIEKNEGSETDALKALWVQHRIEMEWKDYATAAHKSILKLATNYQKICSIISDACGVLAHQGFKTKDGKVLQTHEKFQEMISLGAAVKFQAIEKATTNRHIKAIRYLADDKVELILSCGHSEFTDKATAKKSAFKRGDKMVCPMCVEMMKKLTREL